MIAYVGLLKNLIFFPITVQAFLLNCYQSYRYISLICTFLERNWWLYILHVSPIPLFFKVFLLLFSLPYLSSLQLQTNPTSLFTFFSKPYSTYMFYILHYSPSFFPLYCTSILIYIIILPVLFHCFYETSTPPVFVYFLHLFLLKLPVLAAAPDSFFTFLYTTSHGFYITILTTIVLPILYPIRLILILYSYWPLL